MDQNNNLFIFVDQVSGKTPKLVRQDPSIIYKQFSQPEYLFYKNINQVNINHQNHCLIKFLPEYLGVQEIKLTSNSKVNKDISTESKKDWISHLHTRIDNSVKNIKYLKLKNLTYQYKLSNVLDIKLGTKRDKPGNIKFINSTTNSKKFRINGMSTCMPCKQSPQQHFMSKYFGHKIPEQQIAKNLAIFFFNGNKINKNLLENIISQLKNLILVLKTVKGWRFLSASLLLTYDASNTQKYGVKFIDFDKLQELHSSDDDICDGLINLKFYFEQIMRNCQQIQNQVAMKSLKFFSQEHKIPKDVKDKYENRAKNQQKEQQQIFLQ